MILISWHLLFLTIAPTDSFDIYLRLLFIWHFNFLQIASTDSYRPILMVLIIWHLILLTIASTEENKKIQQMFKIFKISIFQYNIHWLVTFPQLLIGKYLIFVLPIFYTLGPSLVISPTL